MSGPSLSACQSSMKSRYVKYSWAELNTMSTPSCSSSLRTAWASPTVPMSSWMISIGRPSGGSRLMTSLTGKSTCDASRAPTEAKSPVK